MPAMPPPAIRTRLTLFIANGRPYAFAHPPAY
jgi:hypothetical protein